MKNKSWCYERTSFFPGLTEKWVQQINYNCDRKSIVVVGHAGQGKTVSILQYLEGHDTPYIHVRLSDEDKDSRFLLSKITGLLAMTLAEKNSVFKPVKPSSTIDNAQAAVKIVRRYLTAQPKGLTLFFDDTHILPENSEGIDLIIQLIRQSPAEIHFIFAGRDSRNADRIYRVQAEKSCLINVCRPYISLSVYHQWTDSWQLPLSIEQIGRLFFISDDWIAGSLLIARHLRSLNAFDREPFFENLEAGKLPPVVINFFDREVMSSFSLQMQWQLMLLAIPEVIDLKTHQPVSFLLEKKPAIDLVKSNHLFLRNASGGSSCHGLRFNRLFRHYLLDRCNEHFDEKERKQICLHCGKSFVEAQQALLAVGPYLQAGDIVNAKKILIQHAEDTLRHQTGVCLRHWLSYFDEQDIIGDPWMAVFHCASHRFGVMEGRILLLEKAVTDFESQGALTGSMHAVALLIENCILSGDPTCAMPRLYELASSLLEQARSFRVPYANALLRIQLGAYHIFYSGELQIARDHLWKANILSRQIKDNDLQVYALTLLCIGSSLGKDKADANEFRILLAGQVRKGISEVMALFGQSGLAALELNKAQNAQVTRWLPEAKKLTELASWSLLRPFVLFAESMLLFYSKNFGGAASILRHLVQFAHSTNHVFFRNISYRFLAQIAYFENNLAEAENFLSKCERQDMNKPIGLHQARTVQLQAVLDLRQERFDQAGRVLPRLLQEFERHLNHVSVVENCFLLGILAHARGDQAACRKWLDSGFTIAAREKIEEFSVLSPRDIVNACILAVAYVEAGSAAYAEVLLSGRFSQAACEYFEKFSVKGCTRLRERMAQIQKTAVLKNRPAIAVRTLGDFTVLRNDSPIDALQWSGLYPQLLLKTIISRGCKNVVLEQLMEDLWPDHEPQKAMQTFRVTLHRLRKTIEPDINKALGSSYIFFKDGMVSINDQLVDIDTVQYRTLVEQAQKVANSGRKTDALKICRDADTLYRGDYLPGELYSRWADFERNRLLRLRLQQLLLMSDILEAESNMMEAVVVLDKLVSLDPYNELFYRRLIKAYVRLGMRAKAVDVFNTCRTILKTELDTEPDPETQSVYEGLRKH